MVQLRQLIEDFTLTKGKTMSRFVPGDQEIVRAVTAREQFIKRFCEAWPAIYTTLIPCTFDGANLLSAKLAIEQQMDKDFLAIQEMKSSPWVKEGPSGNMIDWSAIEPKQKITLGLSMERELGLPASIKPGVGPDGALYADHPQVLEARRVAHRTCEFVLDRMIRKAERMMKEASSAYLKASNEGGDEATVERLEHEYQVTVDNVDRIRKNFKEKRAKPAKGMEFVRAECTPEELQAEQDDANRPIGA